MHHSHSNKALAIIAGLSMALAVLSLTDRVVQAAAERTFVSMTLTEQLMLHEGVRLKPYKDSVGKWTIGVGRNLSDVGITMGEAEVLLEADIKRARGAAAEYTWFESLNDTRQDVVVDMIFNLGPRGFARFKATHRKIEAGDYAGAARNMLRSKWATQVGTRATRLARWMEEGVKG